MSHGTVSLQSKDLLITMLTVEAFEQMLAHALHNSQFDRFAFWHQYAAIVDRLQFDVTLLWYRVLLLRLAGVCGQVYHEEA